MKSDRLLSALMLLQAQGRLSTRQIAERLEISHRTAHRDMESLCSAGIPLTALRGAQGGWELAKGWRTRVPGLDEAELRALLMAQPSALGDPRLIAAAERAFGKLMAALPSAMREQATTLRARLHIDHTGWHPGSKTPDDLSMLPIVHDAVTRDLRLSFLYTRNDGDTAPRTVDPYGIVCKQSVWYLIARAPAGMRTYRIARMVDVVALSTSFKRPAKFDLAKHWLASTAELRRNNFPATLALSPEACASLQRWCSVSAAKDPSDLPEGWTTHTVEFESRGQARFAVLGMGAQAWLLSPQDLRSEIDEEIRQLAERSKRLN